MLKHIDLTDKQILIITYALTISRVAKLEALSLCKDSFSKSILQDSLDEMKILRNKLYELLE